MDNQSKVILLRGNSGCGKTTTAKLLQKKLGHGTFLIQQDVIRREMLYVKDGINTEAIDLLKELIRYGKEHCAVTIVEGILNAVWYEPLFRDMWNLYGENIYAYYFNIPFEETLRRHQNKPNVNDFGEEEMRRWWNQEDYIGYIKEKTLTEADKQEDIVKQILTEIKNAP